MIADWLTGIGTIAVAFIAIFQDQIRGWLNHPQLDATVEVVPPDSHKTTLARQRDGQIIQSADCYYFRIRVKNNGNRRAEYVEVFASELQKQQADDSYSNRDSFSPMNLVWSNIRKSFLPAISPGMEKLCDLGHIIDPSKRKEFEPQDNPDLGISYDQTLFSFDVEVQSLAKGYIVEPGKYRLKIIIGAANSKPVFKTLEINVTGKWFSDEEKMLREGIGITVL